MSWIHDILSGMLFVLVLYAVVAAVVLYTGYVGTAVYYVEDVLIAPFSVFLAGIAVLAGVANAIIRRI